MSKKLNLSASIDALMAASTTRADDRFARAEKVVAMQPSGTSSSAIAQSADVDLPVRNTTAEVANPAVAPKTGQGGSIIVPIAQVHDNPYNARIFYDQDTVKERAASLAANGQMTPAPACEDPERPGHYFLLGGHYRKRGLLLIGHTEIELKVLPVSSPLDMYRLSYAENDQRADATPMDDAVAWNQLLESRVVKSQEDIAAITGKPRTTITKTLSLLKLPSNVLEVLKENPRKFSLTAGYELTLLAPSVPVSALEKTARDVATGDLSTRDLASLRDRLANKPVPATRQVSRQHKILHGGTEIGVIKDWDSGKLTFEASIADPAIRAEIVSKLKDLVAAEVDRAKAANH